MNGRVRACPSYPLRYRMKTRRAQILDSDCNPMACTHALLWGNNAAWLCTGCGELLGNRTGDTEYVVSCDCGAQYEIARAPNRRSGSLHLGPATGVIQTRSPGG